MSFFFFQKLNLSSRNSQKSKKGMVKGRIRVSESTEANLISIIKYGKTDKMCFDLTFMKFEPPDYLSGIFIS